MYSIFVAAVGLLLRGGDVLGTILGKFIVANRAIPLSDAVGSYEAFEKVVYGEVVFDLNWYASHSFGSI